MKIDGKAIADAILSDLTSQATALKENSIVPTLAVILVGDDPESLAYIRQKQKATERIGGRFIFEHLPRATSPKELAARIAMYNADGAVHGLIVQRPVPLAGDTKSILNTVKPQKDVDGFIPNSPFDVPIAIAIFAILQNIHVDYRQKKIVIVGRGETAGKPIAEAFAKRCFAMAGSDVATISPDFTTALWQRRNNRQCAMSIIDSKTSNPDQIMKNADIIISCVGKKGIVTREALKSDVILISVGIHRGEDGKLHGDYEEDDVKDIASFYTPTPGGVGPLNIASLMQNLVKACTIK